MKQLKLTNWILHYDNKIIPSQVPGDITIDFYKAGLIKDPYIAENYKDAEWIGRKDYTYQCQFEADDELLKFDSIVVKFKGVDLFSTIKLNGHELGKTKNAFLLYTFDIKSYLRIGQNILTVEMTSTLNAMDKIDTTGYSSIFNMPRIFVRKPQCHFGWDWAPKICAYGIIDEVYIEAKNKYQINDVFVVSDNKGNARFNIELNYDNKDLNGPNGTIIKKGEPDDNDTLRLYVAKTPFKEDYEIIDIAMMGVKNFIGYQNKNYHLWWPTGYGKQPLYNYKVELVRGNKVVDVYKGRFAYRTIKILEEPKALDMIGMDFYINDTKIYLKGSNWVPPECFTGCMQDDKYRQLIKLAKNMNANILRVWGGGAYEKDIFFDICDEEGILTWQDVALACADIPEENKEFLDNILEEVIYQVKRLRNHPSLIYWCGGNEKTGCYGNCITHGDFLVNYTLYGIFQHYDGTRPYRRQSPHSFTDIGNNPTSGDSHYGNFENILFSGMDTYREKIAARVTPFVSECAVMGPSSEETLRKIFPKDHIWPMDEMWKDRFMENPYGTSPLDFPHREMFYAEGLYGKTKGLTDFVIKAMAAQAEALRAECEYSRAHNAVTGAFLNWMFDDIWPSGTWSTIDYYLEPKHGYYQLRKSFAPQLVSFYQDNNGKTHLFANNQSLEKMKGQIKYGVKKYDGELLYQNCVDIDVNLNEDFDVVVDCPSINSDTYLFARFNNNTTLYASDMYANKKFENKFDYALTLTDDYHAKLKITAKTFVKSLFIHFPDNFKYLYSDNYLDLEKDQEITIDIESSEKINKSQLSFICLE